jgi:hypothetical protein
VRATVLGLLFLVAAATPAAGAWPPWETVAQGASTLMPSERAFVAGTLRATTPFAVSLTEDDRARLRMVDFRTRVVLAVFRGFTSTGYTLEIQAMRRRKATLRVWVTVRAPTGPVSPVLTVGYHVVSVPRRVLDTPLPRRVVLTSQPDERA